MKGLRLFGAVLFLSAPLAYCAKTKLEVMLINPGVPGVKTLATAYDFDTGKQIWDGKEVTTSSHLLPKVYEIPGRAIIKFYVVEKSFATERPSTTTIIPYYIGSFKGLPIRILIAKDDYGWGVKALYEKKGQEIPFIRIEGDREMIERKIGVPAPLE